MPARKPRPKADLISLNLTESQCEALIEATKLERGLKDRLRQAPAGRRRIAFTEAELIGLGDAAFKALNSVLGARARRLEEVLNKVSSLLDEREQEALRARREDPRRTGAIYQFKVTLRHSRPPIWRRFQMPDGTLGQLHEVLQLVMGWDNSHLHEFVIGRTRYGDPLGDDFADDLDMTDEEDALISQVITQGRPGRFRYSYDFGDDWQHEVVLEKVIEPAPGVLYPRCIAGARACPPEDCGGIWGYPEFVAAFSDPEHPGHESTREWYAADFDAEAFSVEAVNEKLQGLARD